METATSRTVLAVVALGSNIEPRAERLKRALAALAALPGTRLVKASSVLDNPGVDVPPEYAHMRFLNQVAAFETSLEVHDFSRRMHAIEDAHGRVRTGVRNAPRTIDLDLIAFGDLVLNEPELTLPHPRASERAFVTIPLKEILPDFHILNPLSFTSLECRGSCKTSMVEGIIR